MFFASASSLRYVPDQYNIQQMCDEAVDDFLPILNFVADCFVTSNMISPIWDGRFRKYDDLEEAW